jgi:hypothetical protein
VSIPGEFNADTITGNSITITGSANFTGNVEFTGNVTSETANYVTANTQSNITSVGTLVNLTVSGPANLGQVGNVTIAGGSAGYVLVTNGNGVLSWQASGGNYNNDDVRNYLGNFNSNIIPSASNTYSLGNSSRAWRELNVGSNGVYIGGTQLGISNGNLVWGTQTVALTGANTSQNIVTSGNVTANIATFSTLNSNTSTLGNISNVFIYGGNLNQILATDGTGNLRWIDRASGARPEGPIESLQFNAGLGNFGGSQFLTFDSANIELTVAGNLVANSITLGAGTFSFSRSFSFSSTTNSATPNQEIYSVDAASVSRIDFTIISTSNSVGSRQTSTIHVLYYDGNVQYTEVGSLSVNNYLGDWRVNYDPGGVIRDPQVTLTFSPGFSATMTHKMMITTYES